VPALNVRDNTLILGDEIIETPPAVRSRYLETRLLAPIYRHYFDLGARWSTMPRPSLTDHSFDLSYAQDPATTLGGPTEPIYRTEPSPFDVGFEMMLDGAQCLRLGRDLIVNVANANHEQAFRWLERHLSDRYRLHRVHRMSDNHMDSMILALRPGVFLARDDGIRAKMPAPFDRWRFLVAPEPEPGSFPTYGDDDLVLTSPYIDLNVLSLSPDRVIVNKCCHGLRRLLEAEGFTVIPVQHRHRRLFGGGFHCFTLDTHREGGLEDYS
jgi:glycine amidinotransferase